MLGISVGSTDGAKLLGLSVGVIVGFFDANVDGGVDEAPENEIFLSNFNL